MISIHALLAESDHHKMRYYPWISEFLSTLSLRRATAPADPIFPMGVFLSTLSLRRATRGKFIKWKINHHFYPRSPCGERRGLLHHTQRARYFYPRSPCGERPSFLSGRSCFSDFYPRSPCGERLGFYADMMALTAISIHALLAESDCRPVNVTQIFNHFYPRSPCGERP